ncbi:MAG TPA: carbonic anhydrase [Methylomusa anaerophila]|uniref:Carbonic anhydrase n=1 Tax=Methylomusa anaerophila TaxID=1930071 RepID=A0A348AJZ9_9FIRM|nr:carbonic anhydrase [Methylomusa anaerophila]BBB91397.1 carbonic anhydrase [Methylomusa anaerophila]HML90179.1 carbonic anhydrase [Methylomusa anaerophila]
MGTLIKISSQEDIFPEYRGTPIELLLGYHNLNWEYSQYTEAQMLIGMCMDHRKHLRIPENFAYIIRSGGANLRYTEFKVSYAIAVGGVRYIVVIAHNNCGMVNLMSKQKAFIQGLTESAGWKKEWAEEHFRYFAPMFEIGNEIDFVLSESKRLKLRYPKIEVAPMYYRLDDNKLYLIKED